MSKRAFYALVLWLLAFVGWLYAPVAHGDFLWDDWPSLKDLQGDQWLHYVFRDFNRWTYYFRPIPVALFALQIKAFHSAPGPMHLVSLGLHLVNTALVGLLSHRCVRLSPMSQRLSPWLVLACMAIYALHPALIEPVVWIGLQTDLLVTLFTLSGLLVATTVQPRIPRAIALALIFFVAACTKEAASVFPLLVLLFDWILLGQESRRPSVGTSTSALLLRNWPAYAAMFTSGLFYLGLRHWALGHAVYPNATESASWVARYQEICLVYFSYLKVILWPIAGMGPLHPVDPSQFGQLSLASVLTTVGATALLLAGLYLALRQASAVGYIIIAATIALLPVLHILPVTFERSLYHERYAMIAVAVSCSLLPLLNWGYLVDQSHSLSRLGRVATAVVIFIWLAFSAIDIRVILPKWSSDTTLWRWALDLDPGSMQARDNLLLTYIQTGHYAEAHQLGDQFLREPVACVSCLLHYARFALDQGNPASAQAALQRTEHSLLVRRSKDAKQLHALQSGRLLAMQGRFTEAKAALETAVALDPDDEQARKELTDVSAQVKRLDEAH